jgi:hypothetical protein
VPQLRGNASTRASREPEGDKCALIAALLLLALFGHGAMSELSPLCAAKRTSTIPLYLRGAAMATAHVAPARLRGVLKRRDCHNPSSITPTPDGAGPDAASCFILRLAQR